VKGFWYFSKINLRFCSNEFIRLFASKRTTEVVTTMTPPFEKGKFNIEKYLTEFLINRMGTYSNM